VSASDTRVAAARRRRTRYIDRRLQRWPILALVLLQAALVGGSVWLMQGRLQGAIEDSLYRGHLGTAAPLLDQLLREALPLLGIFVVVNLLLVTAIELAWRRRVRLLLRDFLLLIGKTRALDFTPDPPTRPGHELLELAVRYRETERDRLAAIFTGINRLDDAARVAAPAPDQLRQTLEALKALVR
jgi:hypothetical protein